MKDAMQGRCEADVFDGYGDNGDIETDVCSRVLNADGSCPGADHHL